MDNELKAEIEELLASDLDAVAFLVRRKTLERALAQLQGQCAGDNITRVDRYKTCYLNLYPYGVSPYWTLHGSRQIAKADAQSNSFRGKEALHIALPVEIPSTEELADE